MRSFEEIILRPSFTGVVSVIKCNTNSVTGLQNIYFSGKAQRRLCPPHSRGLWITHNDAPQSVGLFWTSD